MLPTLRPDAIAVTLSLPSILHFLFPYKTGSLVVVEAEPDFFIVKRIASFSADEGVILVSDNTATESRFCGTPMCASKLVGRVLFCLP